MTDRKEGAGRQREENGQLDEGPGREGHCRAHHWGRVETRYTIALPLPDALADNPVRDLRVVNVNGLERVISREFAPTRNSLPGQYGYAYLPTYSLTEPCKLLQRHNGSSTPPRHGLRGPPANKTTTPAPANEGDRRQLPAVGSLAALLPLISPRGVIQLNWMGWPSAPPSPERYLTERKTRSRSQT